MLCGQRGTGNDILLHLGHLRDQFLRSDSPSQPPSRHGKTFRHAVDDHGAFFHSGNAADAPAPASVINQRLIYFIGKYGEIAALCKLRDFLQRFFRHDGSGGIVRRVQDDHFCAFRQNRLQIIRLKLEAILRTRIDKDRNSAERADHLRIIDPVRGVNHNLVTRFHQRIECQESGLHSSYRNDDLSFRVRLHPRGSPDIVRNGTTQFKKPRICGIAGISFHNGTACRLADIERRWQIRVSQSKINDIRIP